MQNGALDRRDIGQRAAQPGLRQIGFVHSNDLQNSYVECISKHKPELHESRKPAMRRAF
jgi:hypothetical protein